jgi:hypothetical protein
MTDAQPATTQLFLRLLVFVPARVCRCLFAVAFSAVILTLSSSKGKDPDGLDLPLLSKPF